MKKIKNSYTSNTPNTFFGKNLKFLRSKHGLSQTEFGKHIGLNRNNIASYESGIAEPNIKNLIVICTYFDVGLREILEIDIAATNPSTESKLLTRSLEIEQFISKTREITKISNSHEYFVEMMKNEIGEHPDNHLLGYLQDLINVLRDLLMLNTQFMENISEDSN